MNVYRTSRKPSAQFDPLDSSASIQRDGWRFNDNRTEILYVAEVEALSILEVVARPKWESVVGLTVAVIEIPDDSIVSLHDLGIALPSNWDQRPAAGNAQRIGRAFLTAVDGAQASGRTICGLRVPSVISESDHNVLLDPRQRSRFRVAQRNKIPFGRLLATLT